LWGGYAGWGTFRYRFYANVSFECPACPPTYPPATNNTPWRTFEVLPPIANATANLSYWKIEPCIQDAGGNPTAWKLGEPINISMRIDDADGDLVQGRIILYDDNATYRNDTGWFGAGGVGTWFNNGTLWNYTTFVAGYNIFSSTLVMMVRDAANTTIVNSSQTIMVAGSGVIMGECFTDNSLVAPPVLAPEQGALTTLFQNMLNSINLPLAMLWMLIMIIAVVVVWIKLHYEAVLAGAISLGIVILWSFLGLKLSILSGALFGVIMLLLVLTVGIVIWSKVKQNG
jgi:hypothetical protein